MKRSPWLYTSVLWITLGLLSSSLQAKERINLIYPSISGLVLGLWDAKEAGLFDKYDLDANLIYIQSASAVMQAMLGGDARVALAGAKPGSIRACKVVMPSSSAALRSCRHFTS